MAPDEHRVRQQPKLFRYCRVATLHSERGRQHFARAEERLHTGCGASVLGTFRFLEPKAPDITELLCELKGTHSFFGKVSKLNYFIIWEMPSLYTSSCIRQLNNKVIHCFFSSSPSFIFRFFCSYSEILLKWLQDGGRIIFLKKLKPNSSIMIIISSPNWW